MASSFSTSIYLCLSWNTPSCEDSVIMISLLKYYNKVQISMWVTPPLDGFVSISKNSLVPSFLLEDTVSIICTRDRLYHKFLSKYLPFPSGSTYPTIHPTSCGLILYWICHQPKWCVETSANCIENALDSSIDSLIASVSSSISPPLALEIWNNTSISQGRPTYFQSKKIWYHLQDP